MLDHRTPARDVRRARPGPPASALIEETQAVSNAVGSTPLVFTSLLLAAWRGQESRAIELGEASIEDTPADGTTRAIALAEYARAVLYNGLADYPAAQAAAQRAAAHLDLGIGPWVLAEFVEASSRNGRLELAAAGLASADSGARPGRADRTPGLRIRSGALVAAPEVAEPLYRAALSALAGCGAVLHHARAQLLYGEWLRRQGRRMDAREHLRGSHATFCRIGAGGFADRAQRELVATGATARKRTDDTRDELTAQEAQIARMAASGDTNAEIGARLFLSPRTVEWHLRRVYAKLGIRSRRQLDRPLHETAARTAASA